MSDYNAKVIRKKQAEYSRSYRERNREKINQRRRESRQRQRKSHLNIVSSVQNNNEIEQNNQTISIDQVRKGVHAQRQQRYYDRHKQEINKRKRDSRLRKNVFQSIAATAAERSRNYRIRNKQEINKRKRDKRLKALEAKASVSAALQEETSGTSTSQGGFDTYFDPSQQEQNKQSVLNPFEIEVLPHFVKQENTLDVPDNKIVKIKQEVEVDEYNALPHESFDLQNVKTEMFEDPLTKPSCSYTDLGFSLSESNSRLVIKTESDESDFDLEGRQYAEDLKSLLPEQRNLVRKLLARIMCQAKMNMLSSGCFPELLFSQSI